MKKVLLTRLREDNHDDRLYFQKKGFESIEIPLLALKKRELGQLFEIMLAKSEWVFLTSQHAAEFFFQQVKTDKRYITLETKKFAVIGEKTAVILLKNGIKVDFFSPNPTKASLFKTWAKTYPVATTIFYPKSNLADNTGEADLVQIGHYLFTPILYDNFLLEESNRQLKKYLVDNKIEAVYLASPSLWERFLAIFIETGLNEMPKLYCLGETTKQAITSNGYDVIIKEKDS
ncbi:uroporphyrinogen-III synthase [Enterococcus ureasiticus]|uniref:Uroporphyrinogen-III synthase n=1 Tax=Enterococcus ureasiticus TaxID=903984 RepID=A0A1E5GGW3_9ENTE|nr:uroporphyrinogen-III synthase [Enterococcus ureasiticus]OEG11861.1 hypothetical protein BCR21_06410 [Enterococcus ureasiticus]